MNTLVQNNNTIISCELTAVEMENLIGGGIDPVRNLCWGFELSALRTIPQQNFLALDYFRALLAGFECSGAAIEPMD